MAIWGIRIRFLNLIQGTYDQGTIYTIAGIRRANKKDTGKLLGYISYAIHGGTGLFSIVKAEQWSAKDIVRAVRKALL